MFFCDLESFTHTLPVKKSYSEFVSSGSYIAFWSECHPYNGPDIKTFVAFKFDAFTIALTCGK